MTEMRVVLALTLLCFGILLGKESLRKPELILPAEGGLWLWVEPLSASQYANPHNRGALVNQLDIMILGGYEVDTDFNLNVITGSNGVIMSASGGNADTAAGSKISVVVSDLMKKGNRCLIKDKVITITTPGEAVDAVVTDKGIAINPRRTDLMEKLKDSDLPLVDIHDLYDLGQELGAIKETPDYGDRIVAVAEYRDGTVIDVVRQVR